MKALRYVLPLLFAATVPTVAAFAEEAREHDSRRHESRRHESRGYAYRDNESGEMTEIPFESGKAPPQVSNGKMWCLICHPASYKTVTEEVEVRKATSYFEMVSAKYELEKESILVEPKRQEAYVVPAEFKTERVEQVVDPERTVLEIVPATYEMVEKSVVVTPEYEEEFYQAATYKTVMEQVEVEPARTEYRKVRNKEDSVCSMAMEWCYFTEQIPAKYKTITKMELDQEGKIERRKVLAVTRTVKVWTEVKAAEVKKVVVPARTEMIEVRTLVKPARIELRTVPAKTIEIEKLVQTAPEGKQSVDVPAKVETVTRQVLDKSAWLAWRLCSTQKCLGKYPSLPGIPMQD